jgi:hypothetical protein
MRGLQVIHELQALTVIPGIIHDPGTFEPRRVSVT